MAFAQPRHITGANCKAHSSAWALRFHEFAQQAGVVHHAKFPEDPGETCEDMRNFIVKELQAPAR
jgi:hypothetical protein